MLLCWDLPSKGTKRNFYINIFGGFIFLRRKNRKIFLGIFLFFSSFFCFSKTKIKIYYFDYLTSGPFLSLKDNFFKDIIFDASYDKEKNVYIVTDKDMSQLRGLIKKQSPATTYAVILGKQVSLYNIFDSYLFIKTVSEAIETTYQLNSEPFVLELQNL